MTWWCVHEWDYNEWIIFVLSCVYNGGHIIENTITHKLTYLHCYLWPPTQNSLFILMVFNSIKKQSCFHFQAIYLTVLKWNTNEHIWQISMKFVSFYTVYFCYGCTCTYFLLESLCLHTLSVVKIVFCFSLGLFSFTFHFSVEHFCKICVNF